MSDVVRGERAIAAVAEASAAQGFAVAITVVDTAGALVAFHRMDGCMVGPVDVSQKKARTAALFGMDSTDFGQVAQPGGAIYSIEHTNGGLISFGGGVVLRDADTLVGAIGVAGATTEADEALARAGAQAY